MARRINELKFEKSSVFDGSNQIYVCCARLRPGLMAAMSAVCLLQCIDQLTKRLHLIQWSELFCQHCQRGGLPMRK